MPVVAEKKSEMTFTDFVEIHKPQLLGSGVPERFWNTLYEKLKSEVYDAGNIFQIICEEYTAEDGLEPRSDNKHGWKVVVYTEDGISHTDEENIFLIDHAWTFRTQDIRGYLEEVPSLLDRMVKLMELNTTDLNTEEQIEGVMKHMWKFNQTYSFGSASTTPEGAVPVWYVMDEFGCRIQHSDDPTVITAPFYFIPKQLAFNIMWLTRDLDHGDQVTRDYLPGCTDALIRRARMLPWVDDDLSGIDVTQKEPGKEYFEAYRQNESLPNLDVEFPSITKDRSLKVYMSYGQMLREHLTDPRFELVDDLPSADIIFTSSHYKDYRELSDEFPERFINEFPYEMVITIKDLMAVVARRAAKSETSINPLNAGPKWLPVTYNLQTELPQFVSYFQQREALGLDNHYICKPWNLARGLDMHITSNLDYIVRLPDSGPKVACKYIEDPVLFRREDVGLVKFDIRYIILLSSVQPLKLYAYKVFWLRFANKEYSLDHFDDYDKHYTVMNYRNESELKQVHYNEFIPMFENQYPQFVWTDVEADIFTMLRELFEAATSLPPPQGIAPSPQSRAMYAVDLMLAWHTNEMGERVIQPMLCEVNFAPDCDRACKYHPFFINDVFSTLFLDDTEGKHVTLIS